MTFALILLRRFWPYLAGIALILAAAAYIRHIDHAARTEQKAADTAAITLAQSEARAADLAHARAVEAADTAKKEAADNDLAPQLADARARLAVYAARLRNQADQSSGGGKDLPSAASGAPLAHGPDQAALMDDLDACTENTVRLQNVQAWWEAIAAQP